MDAARSATVLGLLIVTFAAWFFVLPWIQMIFLPTASGGATGPWVIRPPLPVRFCACAILAATTMALLLRFLRKRWNAQDAAAGTQYDPYLNRPLAKAGPYIAGSALVLIYSAALLIYLFSWAFVGPNGIAEHSLWIRRNHAFDQVMLLETIPHGTSRTAASKDGPQYTVFFTDGRKFSISIDNEGCSEADVSAIAKYIAERSNKQRLVRAGGRAE